MTNRMQDMTWQYSRTSWHGKLDARHNDEMAGPDNSYVQLDMANRLQNITLK